jgi:hypothetical protein
MVISCFCVTDLYCRHHFASGTIHRMVMLTLLYLDGAAGPRMRVPLRVACWIEIPLRVASEMGKAYIDLRTSWEKREEPGSACYQMVLMFDSLMLWSRLIKGKPR